MRTPRPRRNSLCLSHYPARTTEPRTPDSLHLPIVIRDVVKGWVPVIPVLLPCSLPGGIERGSCATHHPMTGRCRAVVRTKSVLVFRRTKDARSWHRPQSPQVWRSKHVTYITYITCITYITYIKCIMSFLVEFLAGMARTVSQTPPEARPVPNSQHTPLDGLQKVRAAQGGGADVGGTPGSDG